MELSAPFEPVADHVGVTLPGYRALFTTRRGGVSDGPYASLNLGRWTDDDPAAVARNRERLLALLPPGAAIAQGRQVHQATVARVTAPPDPAAPPREADGQATALPGVAPLVLVADCLPIAVGGEGAVAMLHGGWRGLAAGIVAEGVAAVRELGARGPLTAAIGPGAGGCCYEVGDEVRTAFAAHPDALRDGGRVDLKAVARAQLHAAGVEEVHDAGLCTLCAEPGLLYSHRRDGGVTGRQAGVAWRS